MDEHPFNVQCFRVRAHQTDLNGVTHHGAYLDLFDDARIETFRRLDFTYARSVEEGWSPVIRRLEVEYFQPSFMDDLLSVTVSVEGITPATMTFQYDCRRDGVQIALGHVTFAFINKNGRPVRVPADLRRVVQETPGFMLPSPSP